MTAPVTVRVTPSQGPFCEDNFTVSFFIPFAVQVGMSGVCECSAAGCCVEGQKMGETSDG
jgi:hypothetical protein